jgi:GYF domain 2
MTRFYYEGVNHAPIGPIPLDALTALIASGAVRDETYVIEEGGLDWKPLRTYGAPFPSSSVSGAHASPPPSPFPSVDAVHARVVAGAAIASARVEGGARLTMETFLTTLRSAQTIGERAVVFGSIAVLAAFVLPWFDALGESVNGLGLARQASAYLYLLPVSFAVTFFLSYLNIHGSSRQRILRARWFLTVGSFWLSVALLGVVAGRELFGIAAAGLYLTLVGVAAVTAGGMLQINEQLTSRQ